MTIDSEPASGEERNTLDVFLPNDGPQLQDFIGFHGAQFVYRVIQECPRKPLSSMYGVQVDTHDPSAIIIYVKPADSNFFLHAQVSCQFTDEMMGPFAA